MSRYRLFLATLIIVTASISSALAAGATALISREIDLWPSAVAMGHAAVAGDDPLVAVWVNPAGLVGQPGQAGATHTEWALDTRIEQLAVALGGQHRVRIGLSAVVVTTDDIPLRTSLSGPTTNPLGYFEARDFTVGLSAACAASPTVNLGASLRSLTQKVYTEDASTFALDIGAQWSYSPELRFGAVLSNLGPELDWGSGATVPLPRSLRAGARYDVTSQVTVASDIWVIRDRDARLASGVEWHPVQVFAARTGYLLGSDSQNFTAGFGINYRGIGFDYALAPLGNDLGTTHRVALRVLPGSLRP